MKKFAPQYVHKTRIVTPVSEIPAGIYSLELGPVLTQYHLPEKFLYVPNQFWQHKNHSLVLDALAHFKQRGDTPCVVMSGLFHDHRAPEYTAHLLRRISELDLRGNVILLGLLPREHVYALMRQAIALVNPSLFEGYGMTVAEARWLGKRAVLSDIPAHRVQDPPQARYFDPHSAVALADTLARVWHEYPPGPDLEMEAAARRAYPAHKQACAREFMAVVEEIVQK
jgi:glycosyltransferase involved in cell wall biosynthesis